jgi:hypothetical protein
MKYLQDHKDSEKNHHEVEKVKKGKKRLCFIPENCANCVGVGVGDSTLRLNLFYFCFSALIYNPMRLSWGITRRWSTGDNRGKAVRKQKLPNSSINF